MVFEQCLDKLIFLMNRLSNLVKMIEGVGQGGMNLSQREIVALGDLIVCHPHEVIPDIDMTYLDPPSGDAGFSAADARRLRDVRSSDVIGLGVSHWLRSC